MEVAKKSMAQMVQRTCPRRVLLPCCCSSGSVDGVHAMICLCGLRVHPDVQICWPNEDPKTSVHSNASHERNELRFNTAGRTCTENDLSIPFSRGAHRKAVAMWRIADAVCRALRRFLFHCAGARTPMAGA